jgi:iron complex transport system ATP-binding protein
MSVELHGASFAYLPGMHVFQDLDLRILPGEVFCILGPNGCGKTTLLRCLSGLLKLSKGKALVDGKPLGSFDRRGIARRIGFIPQSHDAAFPYSVHDIVLMGRTPHLSPLAVPSVEDEALAREAIQRMGLEGKSRTSYATLSGGERQLALLARALCQASGVLLMDEPAAHLDLKNQENVLRLMSTLAKEGLSMVFTSHDPGHAFRAAHRVALMHPGGRLTVGRPIDVLTKETLSDAYGVTVEPLVLEREGRPPIWHFVVDD